MTHPRTATWRDGQVIANSMRFHYLDWGDASAEPIIFLHGGSLTAHTWDRVCRELAPTMRCIALDLRGHGDSEWSPVADYSLGACADDVEAFCGVLDIRRATLVGMSFGGRIALTIAARRAAFVRRLVTIDIGPTTPDEELDRLQGFMTESTEPGTLDEIIERVHAADPRRTPESLRLTVPRSLRQLPDGRWTWKFDPRRIPTTFDRAKRDRLAEALWREVARIGCPTLIVRGGLSTMFRDEDAERLARAIPGATWITVEGAGHAVQTDRPHELADIIRAFVAA